MKRFVTIAVVLALASAAAGAQTASQLTPQQKQVFPATTSRARKPRSKHNRINRPKSRTCVRRFHRSRFRPLSLPSLLQSLSNRQRQQIRDLPFL